MAGEGENGNGKLEVTREQLAQMIQDGIKEQTRLQAEAQAQSQQREAEKPKAPAAPTYDEATVMNQVRFYSKSPEGWARLQKEMDAATGGTASSEIAQVKLQLAREKAQRLHGIDDEDAEAFLTGADEATIMRQAKRFSERMKSVKAPAGEDPDRDEETEPRTAPRQAVQRPPSYEANTPQDREKLAEQLFLKAKKEVARF